MHLNLSWPAVSQLQGKNKSSNYSVFCNLEGYLFIYAQYLQLEAEWDSKHLKPLHLKVYTNGSFVIFVKHIFAKSNAHTEVKTF